MSITRNHLTPVHFLTGGPTLTIFKDEMTTYAEKFNDIWKRCQMNILPNYRQVTNGLNLTKI